MFIATTLRYHLSLSAFIWIFECHLNSRIEPFSNILLTSSLPDATYDVISSLELANFDSLKRTCHKEIRPSIDPWGTAKSISFQNYNLTLFESFVFCLLNSYA